MPAGQRGSQLDAIMIRSQRSQPVDEHTHTAREMSALRIDYVEWRGLRKPVREHQVESAALHRFLEHEGRHLRDAEPGFGGAHIAVLVFERQVPRKHGLHALAILREHPLHGFPRARCEVVDAPMPGETARSAFSTSSVANSTLPMLLNGSGIGAQANIDARGDGT